MFGFVEANTKELTKEQLTRYGSVYCGVCRGIRAQSGQTARLGLSYDMAFLSLLLMSLYEPEETGGKRACLTHPLRPRPWVDNVFVRYAADMNVALAYYNAIDDYEDERRPVAKMMSGVFGKELERIREQYPRQCEAMERCIAQLSAMEKDGCQNPEEPAGCFGQLMAELLVYDEDMWAPTLREMGMALGRFIYLADAAIDYRRDKRKKQYNPFLAMGMAEDWETWEQYLVLTMARCTDYFERLPLVQDKAILDNILYSGVWTQYRTRQRGKKT